MTVIDIHQAPASIEAPRHARMSTRWIVGVAATASAAVLLWGSAAPLADGFKTGGRAAITERLPRLGARVEDFVPEDRGSIAKPVAGALFVGMMTKVGEKLGDVFVGGSWPVAQAWFDRKTHKTERMVWRVPKYIDHGKPFGFEDTITTIKFEEKSNLALAYNVVHWFASIGLDIDKFNMTAAAQLDGCNCFYRTYGREIEVWTSGKVHGTLLSEKKKLLFLVDGTMDMDGRFVAGTVDGSFEGHHLNGRMLLGSTDDERLDDQRLGH